MLPINTLAAPAREFTVLPFWFWNDELDEQELVRQIADFEAHGVFGFVIHPRVGLPCELGWMSPRLLHFYRIAIAEAARRSMWVVLYDDGMYPSGSSSGQVVAANPEHACRGLLMQSLGEGDSPRLGETDRLVAVVRRRDGSRIAVVDSRVGSRIRGLHYIGDGAEEEPPAADLLNPAAVKSFMKLVYDRFADEFGASFGTTIRAIFTDEPSLLAKCRNKDAMPGTTGIVPIVSKTLGYDFTPHLPCLWFDDEPDALRHRENYLRAVNLRLHKTYNEPLSNWCAAHGVALTGHPRDPDDLGALRHMQIPGQDLVWRRVLPDHPSALEGPESTQAKCSSSAMIHYGRRRNANECFGAYGHELTWNDMVWLALWAFVRGVNLLYPHAFYYSIRGVRRNERPPDVGPHASWWHDYGRFALACRRLSWLNTDSVAVCDVAILGVGGHLPWRAARVCFESQRDFAYVSERDVTHEARIDADALAIGAGTYRMLIVEQEPSAAVRRALEPFAAHVVFFGADSPPEQLATSIQRHSRVERVATKPASGLRVRQVIKARVRHVLFFNEASGELKVPLQLRDARGADPTDVVSVDPFTGRRELWQPSHDALRTLALPGHRCAIGLMLENRPFQSLFDRRVQWQTPFALEADSRLLLFTACDSHYLDFALSLACSADTFSPGLDILLHLINPRDGDLARVAKLAGRLQSTRVALSTEQINLAGLDAEAQRTYFASARFLRLAELMPLLDVPVLCLDADSLIVNPIDLDFSNKPDAEMCLVRRASSGALAAELAVANGSIWFKPTAGVQDFLAAVANDLVASFERGEASWYLDQVTVGRRAASASGLRVFNIKKKYADWEFRNESIVWAGKGERKQSSPVFSLLQRALSDDPDRQQQALRLATELFPAAVGGSGSQRRFAVASRRLPPRIALFLPRLDMPWKVPANPQAPFPVLAEDTLALRLHWKEFAIRMANALERRGLAVDLHEIPAWHIDADRVDAAGAALALIPHRCSRDYEFGRTPVRFYMQEFFRGVFTVDPKGWGAAASVYPVAVESAAARDVGGAFDVYRERLERGELPSKFRQPERVTRSALEGAGQLPREPYIFFPLQIPHDQSIRYFSERSECEIVRGLLEWSKTSGVAVVMKPHPVNPKSMIEFAALAREMNAFWSEAHVHELIDHSAAVYTMNSGVGFEALLHVKPVVTFARVEYDSVTFRADLQSLDAAWSWAQGATPPVLEPRYGAFVDWFLDRYAVDMSRPKTAALRLDAIAAQIAGDLSLSATRQPPSSARRDDSHALGRPGATPL